MADEQLSVREKRFRERQEWIRKNNPNPAGVRVLPRDDDIRKFIVHQPTQIAFPESGSVEWPDDAFTQRRIADGDVTLEAQPQQPSEPPKPTPPTPPSPGKVVSASGEAGGGST